MNISSALFLKSSTKLAQCPPDKFPEFAFAGRSNTGKSSLINMLTGFGSLAKISSTPGKTQLINHFIINDTWYLVDLPGYGYARVSQSSRAEWEKMVQEYLKNRPSLYNIFLLIDACIPPQKSDLEFLKWIGKNEIPVSIVFTKIDRVKKNELAKNIAAFKKELLLYWDDLPPMFYTSSKKREGREEILKYIETSINN